MKFKFHHMNLCSDSLPCLTKFYQTLFDLGIRYSDYGKWAIAGWYQVCLQDPDGNVVEVHQPGR